MQRIVLRMPAAFTFRAGQYLEVLHPDGPIPLSIASGPARLPALHLHYRSTPGVADATRMDELLAAAVEPGATLDVRGPGGDVSLPDTLAAPALIVAGGTGIAQALSLIDAFTGQDPGGRVTVLWCADRDEDFYLGAELDALKFDWLQVVRIADPARGPDNRGLVWLREQAATLLTADSPVVLAGGPPFVHAACDVLIDAGVDLARMQSDVFSYAPRG